jgi:hypothetical protein
LGLALLAAVLLHALWLAGAHLQQRRQPPPTRPQRADDTPELLVFSRQSPEPLDLETLPLPPQQAMPPPPPLALPPARKASRPALPAARAPSTPTSGRHPGPPPPPPPPSPQSAAGPREGAALQAWRTLWQGAEASPSAAPDAGPAEIEVRRLPLARARAEGLEPESGRVLRFDELVLLPWIVGDQLWLVRLPD